MAGLRVSGALKDLACLPAIRSFPKCSPGNCGEKKKARGSTPARLAVALEENQAALFANFAACLTWNLHPGGKCTAGARCRAPGLLKSRADVRS
jgi:hypothetical protein